MTQEPGSGYRPGFLRRSGVYPSALIAEAYRGGRFSALYTFVMRLLLRAAFLDDAEHRNLLSQAGFTEVSTLHLPGKSWICALGRKPR